MGPRGEKCGGRGECCFHVSHADCLLNNVYMYLDFQKRKMKSVSQAQLYYGNSGKSVLVIWFLVFPVYSLIGFYKKLLLFSFVFVLI